MNFSNERTFQTLIVKIRVWSKIGNIDTNFTGFMKGGSSPCKKCHGMQRLQNERNGIQNFEQNKKIKKSDEMCINKHLKKMAKNDLPCHYPMVRFSVNVSDDPDPGKLKLPPKNEKKES
jgi:hypothetical protein